MRPSFDLVCFKKISPGVRNGFVPRVEGSPASRSLAERPAPAPGGSFGVGRGRSAASAARPENLNLRRSSAFHCEAKRCIVSPLLAKFFHEVFAMSNSVEDLQMLRLIRAFQKLTDQGTRRMVLLYVEDQVQKQQAEGPVECSTKSSPGTGSSTTVDS
jgi:hypothetical protein